MLHKRSNAHNRYLFLDYIVHPNQNNSSYFLQRLQICLQKKIENYEILQAQKRNELIFGGDKANSIIISSVWRLTTGETSTSRYSCTITNLVGGINACYIDFNV